MCRTRILSAEIVCDRREAQIFWHRLVQIEVVRDRAKEKRYNGDKVLPEAYDSGDPKIVRVAMEVDEKTQRDSLVRLSASSG